MKTRPVGVELLHADRQTDRQTEMTKSLFRNFANAPKKGELSFLGEMQIRPCRVIYNQ